MNFLSWNCRGFGNKSKVESIKYLKYLSNPFVILLQETKMEDSTVLETTKKIYESRGGSEISSQGGSSGIVTLWDDQI
jgi:exonuclease III